MAADHAHVWQDVHLINSTYYTCKRCDAEAVKCWQCGTMIVGASECGEDYCTDCSIADTSRLLDELYDHGALEEFCDGPSEPDEEWGEP